MSANNKFEIMIDFLVNLKTDPSQIETFSKEFAEKAKGLNVNINSEQMKAGITDVLSNLKALESEGTNLDNIFNAMKLNVNTDEARSALEQLQETTKSTDLSGIGNIDMSGLSEAFSNIPIEDLEGIGTALNDAFNNFDTSKLDTELKSASEHFKKLGSEAQKGYEGAFQSASKLVMEGKKGTAEYEQTIAEAKKYKKVIDDIESAEKAVNKELSGAGKSNFLKDSMTTMLGVVGGGAITAGIGGLTSGLHSIFEAGVHSYEMTEQLDLSFKQAGLSGAELEKQMEETGKFAVKLSNDFAVPISTIKSYSATAAAIGGATGKANEDIVQLAIGVEKASHGMISGEMAIRTFSRGLNDPEGMANLGRLKLQFPQLATALKGITEPAELVRVAMQTLSPTFDTLKEQALGPVGSIQRLENSFTQVKANLGRSLLELFAPVMESVGTYLVPAIQSFSSGISGLIGFIKEHQDIVKILVVAIGAIGATSFIAGGGLTKLAGNVVEFATSIGTKLIPSLAAQTAAQEGANAAILANPYVLAIAAIAGLVIGLKLLSDALSDTAEKRLKSAENEKKLLDNEAEGVQKDIDRTKSTQELAKQYEELGSKANKTAEEHQRFNEIQNKLIELYPGVISGTKSYSDNLVSLKGKIADSSQELEKLNAQMSGIQDRKVNIEVKATAAQADVSFDKLAEGAAKSSRTAIGAALDQVDFITGQSTMNIAKKALQPYYDAMNNAKDEPALIEAKAKFKEAIQTEAGGFGISTEGKAKAMEDIDKLYSDIEKKNTAQKEKVEHDISKQVSGIAAIGGQMTEEQAQSIAASTGGTLEQVTETFDKTRKKIIETNVGQAINDSMEVKGKIQAVDQLDNLVNQFNKTGDEIEKAKIGEKIKAIAPDAVEAGKVISDSNGDAIVTYSLLTDKIKTASEAEKVRQKDALSGDSNKIKEIIGQEGEAYKENFEKLKKVQEEISKAPPGTDTEPLKKEFEDLSKQMSNSKNNMLDTVLQLKAKGLDTKEIYKQMADELGKSPKEIKKMLEEQEKSRVKSEEEVSAIKKITDAWGEARKASQQEINNDEILLSQDQLRRTELLKKSKSDWTTDEQYFMSNYTQIQKHYIDNGKEAVKQEKEKTDAMKKSKELIDPTIKQGQSALQQAKEEIATRKEHYDTQLKTFTLAQEYSILDEKRQKNQVDEIVLARKGLQTELDIRDAAYQSLQVHGLIADKIWNEKEIKSYDNLFDKYKENQEWLKNADEITRDDAELDKTSTKEKINTLNEQEKYQKQIYDDLLLANKANADTPKMYNRISEALNVSVTDLKTFVNMSQSIKPLDITVKAGKDTKKTEAEVNKIVEDYNQSIKTAEIKVKDLEIKVVANKEQIDREMAKINEKQYAINVELGLITSDQQFKDAMNNYQAIIDKSTLKIKKIELDTSNVDSDFKKQADALQDKFFTGTITKERYNLEIKLLDVNKIERYNVLNKQWTEEKNIQLDTQKEMITKEKEHFNQQLTEIDNVYSEIKDKTEKSYNVQTEIAQKFYETISEGDKAAYDKKDKNMLSNIDSQQAAELKKLELWQTNQVISKETFEKKKLDLESKYNKLKEDEQTKAAERQKVLEDRKNGFLLESQNEKDVVSAQMEQAKAEAELKLFQDKYSEQGINFDNLIAAQEEYQKSSLELAKDSNNEQKRQNAKAAKERLEQAKKGIAPEDVDKILKSASALDTAKKTIDEKGNLINESMGLLQSNMSTAIAGLFTGDPDAVKKSAKSFFATMAGIIEKQLDLFVLNLILSPGVVQFIGALPFPLDILSIPIIQATVTGAIHSIITPLLSNIMSFSTGSGPLTTPTMAIIGDAPGQAERVLRDDQLTVLVNSVLTKFSEKLFPLLNIGLERNNITIQKQLSESKTSTDTTIQKFNETTYQKQMNNIISNINAIQQFRDEGKGTEIQKIVQSGVSGQSNAHLEALNKKMDILISKIDSGNNSVTNNNTTVQNSNNADVVQELRTVQDILSSQKLVIDGQNINLVSTRATIQKNNRSI